MADDCNGILFNPQDFKTSQTMSQPIDINGLVADIANNPEIVSAVLVLICCVCIGIGFLVPAKKKDF